MISRLRLCQFVTPNGSFHLDLSNTHCRKRFRSISFVEFTAAIKISHRGTFRGWKKFVCCKRTFSSVLCVGTQFSFRESSEVKLNCVRRLLYWMCAFLKNLFACIKFNEFLRLIANFYRQ